ncbi:MAG TPA: CoA transferase [Amycolatopsis sp.]|nr:CoA transferase [Amycolatopsis sp.]
MHAILENVKVVEAAEWVMAPGAAAILAGWGADVVKIEHPLRGDPLRGTLSSLGRDTGFNFYAEQNNHSKRSIGLDLGQDEGRAVFRKMIAEADVFVTSLLEPAREKWGLTYEDLRAINPRLVYARSSGQGQRGPDAYRPGYDTISYWARGGVGHMASPTGGPYRYMPAGGFGDVQGALALACGILGGLLRRTTTGEGGLVDVSLLGVAVWDIYEVLQVTNALKIDAKDEFKPGGLPNNPLTGLYLTKDDRNVALSMLDSDRYWTQFCQAIEITGLEHDARFATFHARAANREALTEIIADRLRGYTLREVSGRLREHGCAFAPFALPEEVIQDPQVRENGYLLEHPRGGGHFVVAPPVQFDGEPPPVRAPAPETGQHTEEILLELGYAWDQIIGLKDANVIT